MKSIPAYVSHFSRYIHLNSHAPTFVNRYVEKSDFVVIVAPGCLHADRRDPDTKLRTKTCYRTYRNRGWCVLEMFASFLSREKTHPTLLITSSEGTPEWVSPLEAQNLQWVCVTLHVVNEITSLATRSCPVIVVSLVKFLRR